MDIMWPISQIILPCISFIFIEMNFIHYHSYVMFAIESMSIGNDKIEL